VQSQSGLQHWGFLNTANSELALGANNLFHIIKGAVYLPIKGELQLKHKWGPTDYA